MRAMTLTALLSLLGIMLAVPKQTAAVYCGEDYEIIYLKLTTRMVDSEQEPFVADEWNGRLLAWGTSQTRLLVSDSEGEYLVMLDFFREKGESND